MKKILITDDQVEVRELVEVTLRVDDYIILQAKNAEEAITIAKREKPELILMDVMMPGSIDGFEATKILKSMPETRDSIVVILSAKGQRLDKEKGKGAGADAYFVKPFSPLELIQKVEQVLDENE
jgi:two-component system, OmpR family, phosphate regulon response regulator PhoB